MIITAHTGKNFKGVLAYVYRENKELPEEQKPIILEENLVWGNASLQASLMHKVTEKNSNSGRPVLHITVSYPINEQLNQAETHQHLKEIVKEFGASEDNNQYTITAHKDSLKDIINGTAHYHIVINKVGLNGENINTNWIKNKAHIVADKIEKQFNLEPTIGRKVLYDPTNEKGYRFTTKEERAKTAKAKKAIGKHIISDKRPNVKIAKAEIEAKVAEVLQIAKHPAKNIEELQSKLAERGIEVRFSYNKENGNAIRGASFKSDKVSVGGSEIGFKWPEIKAILEINNKQAIDKNISSQEAIQPIKEILPLAMPTASQLTKQNEVFENVNKEQASQVLRQLPTQVFEQPKKEDFAEKVPLAMPTALQLINQNKLREIVTSTANEVLQTATIQQEFKERLAENGIDADLKNNKTGLYGATFTKDGISFKGSDIGLKGKYIEEKLRANFDQAQTPGIITEKPVAQPKKEDSAEKVPLAMPTALQLIKQNEVRESVTSKANEVSQTAKVPQEFKEKLAEKGVLAELEKNKIGEIIGVNFVENGVKIKGSDIGLEWKDIEVKLRANYDQAQMPGITTEKPVSQPQFEEELKEKEFVPTPFVFTAREKEEIALSNKYNEFIKVSLESYPNQTHNIVGHLKKYDNVKEVKGDLLIEIDKVTRKIPLKDYQFLQTGMDLAYSDYKKEVFAYEKLKSTPKERINWYDTSRTKQEKTVKNKQIDNAVKPDSFSIHTKDKQAIIKKFQYEHPALEREKQHNQTQEKERVAILAKNLGIRNKIKMHDKKQDLGDEKPRKIDIEKYKDDDRDIDQKPTFKLRP